MKWPPVIYLGAGVGGSCIQIASVLLGSFPPTLSAVLGWLVAAGWAVAAWGWHKHALAARGRLQRSPQVIVEVDPAVGLPSGMDERELANALVDAMRREGLG